MHNAAMGDLAATYARSLAEAEDELRWARRADALEQASSREAGWAQQRNIFQASLAEAEAAVEEQERTVGRRRAPGGHGELVAQVNAESHRLG